MPSLISRIGCLGAFLACALSSSQIAMKERVQKQVDSIISDNAMRARQLLVDKCVWCHDGVHHPHGPDFGSADEITADNHLGLGGIITLGNPDASVLIKRLIATDPRRMPPPYAVADEGPFDPLATEEIVVIRQWIEGMTQDDISKLPAQLQEGSK